jgi:hypothetical protein
MKDLYETPALDVVRFDCEDVITTSGDDIVEGGNGDSAVELPDDFS